MTQIKHPPINPGRFSDSQIAALEKKKDDDLTCGEIETAHPGYLGSQDTFYVGNLKGVGRIYQQIFVDTYSKVAHCKLYTSKTPIMAAHFRSLPVLPYLHIQMLQFQYFLCQG